MNKRIGRFGHVDAFTLVEIMIIVALIGLLAVLAVPGFTKVRKQSQAKRIVNDARIIDAAVDGWALENAKTDGDPVDVAAIATFTSTGTITTNDILGNAYTFAAELTELLAALKTSERRACVTISCPSAMVCHTEFPRMPMDEIKSALKLNSARYLRRDFSNYYLDAVELTDGNGKDKGKKSAKMKILVGGATKEEVTWYRNVLQAAKLRPEAVELS